MFKTLLPPNATPLELAAEESMAAAYAHPVDIDGLWSPQDCPIELLTYLAWALSVDGWDASWSDDRKRAVVQSSVFVHRHKGTAGAVKAALAALDLGVTISQWFKHGGAPFTFRADLRALDRSISEKDITDIHDAIRASKNARSHLERLRIYLTSEQSVFVGMSTRRGLIIRLAPYVAKIPDQTISSYVGMTTTVRRTIKLEAYP